MTKVAFFLDYDKYQRGDAPAILQFVQLLRQNHSVDFYSSESELLGALDSETYDCVAISALSSLELGYALKTAEKAKKTDPGLSVIMGGQGVTGFSEKILDSIGVDAVVEGEADITFPLMLNHISRGGISEELAEEIMREKFLRKTSIGDINVPISDIYLHTPRGKVCRCFDSAEFREAAMELNPEFEYSAIKNLLHPYPNSREVDSLFFSYPWDIVEKKGYTKLSLYVQRGCNWRSCAYCSITSSPGRRVSPEKVLNTLEEATEHGIEEVVFDDDQFVQSKSWCTELLQGIVDRKLNKKLRFGAMVRVDALDSGIIEKLKEANFVKLQIGVESFLPEKIKYFHKTPPGREREYVIKARELILNLNSQELETGVFIITTRPKHRGALVEICREIEEILTLALECVETNHRLPTFSFSDFLMAYPGAPLLSKEEYKKMAVEFSTPKGKEVFEIPYMFEFRSSALLGFFSSLREISKRRGLPIEIVNETLEHIEDILLALKFTAESLDSTPAVVLQSVIAALEQLDKEEKSKLTLYIGGDIESLRAQLTKIALGNPEKAGEILREVNPDCWQPEKVRQELRKEKEDVLRRLRGLDRLLYQVEIACHLRIKRHMQNSKKKLQEANPDNVEERIQEVRAKAEDLLRRYYPYYRGRVTLENQLSWLDEFERATVLKKPP